MSGGPVRDDELALEKRAALERKLLEKLASKKGREDRRGQIPRRTSTEPAPLSYGQQRMWFLEKFAPDTGAYNIPRALRVRGPLDVKSLRAALNAIVARHEALRTIFTEQGGQPLQQLRSDTSVDLLQIESLLSRRARARRRLLPAVARRGPASFQPRRDLMLRAMVVRLGVDDHGLLIVMHHIASDGWSMAIFIRELVELYDAHRAGRPAKLSALPIQYADFSEWQRQWLSGPELGQQLEYWKQQLAGAATLEMPTDRPRPAVMGSAGDRQSRMIPPATHEAIKAARQGCGRDLFMTLLAAFQLLLHRYSGQTTSRRVADRRTHSPRDRGLIGFFVNTLVLRTDLSGNPRFRELLARVRSRLEAYAHQDAPVREAGEQLRPERDTSRIAPLPGDVRAAERAAGEAGAGRPLDGKSGRRLNASKFDLSMSVFEERGRSEGAGHVQHRPVRRRHDRPAFSVTTRPSSRASPRTPSSDQQAADPGRRREEQLLVTWNQTGADLPRRCVHELITAQAARTPSAVALSRGASTRPTASSIAARTSSPDCLQRQGVGPDSLVGIFCERSIETVIGMLGRAESGRRLRASRPRLPPRSRGLHGRPLGLSVILTHGRWWRACPSIRHDVIRLDADRPSIDAESRRGSSLVPRRSPSPTCSTPRDRPASPRACRSRTARWSTSSVGEAASRPVVGDRVLAVDQLLVRHRRAGALAAAHGGRPTEVASVADAMDWRQAEPPAGASAKITVMQATPSTFQLLLAAGWRGAPGLKVLAGGEAMPRELADAPARARARRCGTCTGPPRPPSGPRSSRLTRRSRDRCPIGRPHRQHADSTSSTPRTAARADRRPGRALHRRRRGWPAATSAGPSSPPSASSPIRSRGAGGAAVPHRRPGPLPARRDARVPRPRRPSRSRSAASASSSARSRRRSARIPSARGGGRWSARTPRRPAPVRLCGACVRRRPSSPAALRATLAADAARLHGAQRVRARRRAAADHQRQD